MKFEWFGLVALIVALLVGIFGFGFQEGRRMVNTQCTDPSVIMNSLGRPGVKPYTVYQCNEGLRAFYDDEYQIVREVRLERVK
jgi:hypothetical protein